ncbi:MAG: hypothetical protein ACK52U_11575 [Synechococcaceae cyanobacterium]|jgi:hypothetical protein
MGTAPNRGITAEPLFRQIEDGTGVGVQPLQAPAHHLKRARRDL